MTDSVLYIDFETRSTVDLREYGLDNYAKHPDTDIWCLGGAFDDEDVWIADECDLANGASRVFRHIHQGGKVVAHNAAFELAIWNHILAPRYRWPELRAEQCLDTMCMAYAMALPGALENAAPAAGLDYQKDMVGHRLMLQMCRPRSVERGRTIWWDDDERKERLFAYCKRDVEVERALYQRLVKLSDDEQALWVLDQRINQRGIYLDQRAIAGAVKIVQAEQDRLNAEIRKVTEGAVGFCTEVAAITRWVRAEGVPIPALAKADVLDALADDGLPANVRRVLELRQEAGKTSTAKLQTMLRNVSGDGRIRGTLQYHGASTGRWAGRKVQFHNLVRPKMKPQHVEQAIEIMRGAA